jgi:predicted porin
MQKKIIALAIAAAISAPAFADNANITVYGKAILDIENVSNDKSTLSGATRVQTNASRLGFKGKEDLGDGLSAFFQYEVEFDADGSGNTVTAKDAAAPTTGNAASTATYTATPSGFGKTRNSGVGLEGGFGTVILGIWDTPFKTSHNKVELFDNTTVFSATNVMGRAAGTKNFNTRAANAFVYVAPSLAGVVVSAAYVPDEGKSTGDAATQGSNKGIASLAGTYDADGVYVAAAYERRADNTTAGTNDTAARLVARYTLGDFWLGATVESFTINTFATASYSQNNTELSGQYKLGASSIGLSYAKAGETATAATGASQVSLRYGFNLSKRTELFAAYTQLKNDTAGVYGFNAGTAFGTTAGSTQSAIGTGMIVSF